MTTKMFTIDKVRRDIRDGLLPSYTTRELLELAAWLRERATEASESTGPTQDLVRALGRDMTLIARGVEWLREDDERGSP